jgi:hypothetical protein
MVGFREMALFPVQKWNGLWLTVQFPDWKQNVHIIGVLEIEWFQYSDVGFLDDHCSWTI